MNLIYPISALATLAVASCHQANLRRARQHNAKHDDIHTRARSLLAGMSREDLKDVLDEVRGTIWRQQLSDDASVANQTCVSPLRKWRNEQIERMGSEVHEWLEERLVFDMPLLAKAFFDRLELGEFIDVNGEETEEMMARHENAKAFWESVDVDQSLDTHRIKLLGAHGTILQNDLAMTLVLLVSGKDSTASEVQDYIETNVPDGFNNPLFTLNAVAVKSLLFGLVPPAIVIGDGLLAFFNDIGLGKDGPDFVLAHEFGHQVQFGNKLVNNFIGLPTPEQTRYTELMADALAGYYLAHSKGGGFSVERIEELHESAFAVGDCNATAVGHHGTPLQRECAAEWGAAEALAPDEIMHPGNIKEAFDLVVDDIVTLQASACKKLASRRL